MCALARTMFDLLDVQHAMLREEFFFVLGSAKGGNDFRSGGAFTDRSYIFCKFATFLRGENAVGLWCRPTKPMKCDPKRVLINPACCRSVYPRAALHLVAAGMQSSRKVRVALADFDLKRKFRIVRDSLTFARRSSADSKTDNGSKH
jgi:hypothetical protein